MASEKERETIDYIKRLAQTLQAESESSDSLVLSESQQSQATLPCPKPKKTRSPAGTYVSPYKQARISIAGIERTGRSRINPINFSNTLLQLATSREKHESQPSKNSSPSRYRRNPSILQKLEGSDLDRLRFQAKEMHEIQERQRLAMTPRQKNEKWADFLLRERKWQEERQAWEVKHRQRELAQQHEQSLFRRAEPREAPGLSRENLIRKIKRERLKLEQQLQSVSARPYRWREVNIKGEKGSEKWSSVDKGKVVLGEASEAAFLLEA